MAKKRSDFVDKLYYYSATVIEVVDGDTVKVHADLGFRFKWEQRSLRLAGINAPEMSSEDPSILAKAQAAKAFLQTLVKPDDIVLIHTHTDVPDKYGRILADVWVNPKDDSLSNLMLASKLVRRWDGKGEKPV